MMRDYLVVINPQNDFVNGNIPADNGEELIKKIAQKINKYMDNITDGNIYVVLDTHYDDYLLTNEGRHLRIEHCMINTSGAYIHKEIRDIITKHENYIGTVRYVHKNTYGSIDLVQAIKRELSLYSENLIANIHIIGMLIENDIITNAILLKSFFPEANVNVHFDCCGTLSNADKENTFIALKNCNINICFDEVELN